MSPINKIPLSQIETSGLQVRVETNRGHVDDLAELFEASGGEWPAALPALIVYGDGERYWLADGHHRLMAAAEAGCSEVPCEVHDGDKERALIHALGANAKHGLRRTNADKRNAVRIAYMLDPRMTGRTLAEVCNVGVSLACDVVREVRAEREKQAAPLCAAHSQPTESAAPVADYAPCKVESSPLPESDYAPCKVDSDATDYAPCKVEVAPAPDYRTGKDGRRINVANIGKRTSSPTTASNDAMPVDGVGQPLTAEMASAFATALEMDGIVADLRKIQTRISALSGQRGAELLRTSLRCEKHGDAERWKSVDIANIISAIQHYRPHATCPSCRTAIKPSCDVCKGLGYLNESAYGRVPDRLKQSPRN